MNGQGLRGFVGQGMTARRPTLSPIVWTYVAGPTGDAAYSFAAPLAGVYRFVLWGPGGTNSSGALSGGGGGALVIAERPLSAGQIVSLVVGRGGFGNNNPSTATFSNGEVLSAGAGASGSTSSPGGVAVCNPALGDVGVPGQTGSSSSSGGGVSGASYGNYQGGPAGIYSASSAGTTPGASSPGAATGTHRAGDGLIIVTQTQMRQ